MSFAAQVLRVLIASPSDVVEEREIAVRAIQEWNDLHASERQIVLLPLRWETHSAPDYGKRPQESINKQVVDHCDLVVGIFWTRIGSPTGVADSGTIEEIERVASLGRPVMLYFSQANQNPEKIDVDQLTKLRDFKKRIFPTALVENFAVQSEFRDKLFKQIDIKVRELALEIGATSPENELRSSVSVELQFAESDSGNGCGSDICLQTCLLELEGIDTLPDYGVSGIDPAINNVSAGALTRYWLNDIQKLDINKDYYRQYATFMMLQEFFAPLRFWLKNMGGLSARDVHIEFSMSSDNDIYCLSRQDIFLSPPSTTKSNYTLISPAYPNSPDEFLPMGRQNWRTSIELRALQPQREISPEPMIYIGAKEDANVVIAATIFADGLSIPVEKKLYLRLDVTRKTCPAASCSGV